MGLRRSVGSYICTLNPAECSPANWIDREHEDAWGFSLNGKRVRFLGFVEATNQEAAESTVVDELGLSHKQRKRLVVQELPGKVRAAAVSALNLNTEPRRERG